MAVIEARFVTMALRMMHEFRRIEMNLGTWGSNCWLRRGDCVRARKLEY